MLHNRKNAKLSAAKAFQIRQDYAVGGKTQAQLAVEHGVSLNTIRNVLQGVTWQQVPMPVAGEQEAYDIQQSQERLKDLLAVPSDLSDLSKIVGRMAPTEDPLEEIIRRRSQYAAQPPAAKAPPHLPLDNQQNSSPPSPSEAASEPESPDPSGLGSPPHEDRG